MYWRPGLEMPTYDNGTQGPPTHLPIRSTSTSGSATSQGSGRSYPKQTSRQPGPKGSYGRPCDLQSWNQIHAETVAYLADLNDADLDQQVTYTVTIDGETRTRKVWHMLLQVVNHQTEHRAQIGTMLGQMGLDVPRPISWCT
jgi:DinB family